MGRGIDGGGEVEGVPCPVESVEGGECECGSRGG